MWQQTSEAGMAHCMWRLVLHGSHTWADTPLRQNSYWLSQVPQLTTQEDRGTWLLLTPSYWIQFCNKWELGCRSKRYQQQLLMQNRLKTNARILSCDKNLQIFFKYLIYFLNIADKTIDMAAHIGIIGSGLIGKSWAMIFASVGYKVRLFVC